MPTPRTTATGKKLPWKQRAVAQFEKWTNWSSRTRARGRYARRWARTEIKRMFPHFDTDEATTQLINFHGRKCVFRAQDYSTKMNVFYRYLGHSILYAAFPNHGIIPEGVVRERIELDNGKKSHAKYWGMVSRLINPVDYIHHVYQEWWYKRGGVQ